MKNSTMKKIVDAITERKNMYTHLVKEGDPDSKETGFYQARKMEIETVLSIIENYKNMD